MRHDAIAVIGVLGFPQDRGRRCGSVRSCGGCRAYLGGRGGLLGGLWRRGGWHAVVRAAVHAASLDGHDADIDRCHGAAGAGMLIGSRADTLAIAGSVVISPLDAAGVDLADGLFGGL